MYFSATHIHFFLTASLNSKLTTPPLAAFLKPLSTITHSLFSVARWQNFIPSFPWIALGKRVGDGRIQGKEGIKFCCIA